jgi:hypothetical protein
MATLVSPGVDITVSDESFYSPGGPGTVPLIILATHQDKTNPDGSGTAGFTKLADANEVKLITSQRELLQQYGNPTFYSTGGTPSHGNELNEYGLLAAHSFLGLASRAYVLRADIDLNGLKPLASAPSPAPANGTVWLDSSATKWGIFKYNTSTSKYEEFATPYIFTKDDVASGGAPKNSVGKDGDIAVLGVDSSGNAIANITYYYKYSSAWYDMTTLASSFTNVVGKDFQVTTHLNRPVLQADSGALANGDMIVQTTSLASGLKYAVKVYNSTTKAWTTSTADAYANTKAAYAAISSPVDGSLFVEFDPDNDDSSINGKFNIKRHNGASSNQVQGTAVTANADVSSHSGSVSLVLNLDQGANINVTFTTESDNGKAIVDDYVKDINAALSSASATTVTASNVSNKLTLTDTAGKDIRVRAGTVAGYGPANVNITAGTYSNWKPVQGVTTANYSFGSASPSGDLTDGTLWYHDSTSVNLWYNKNVAGTQTWTLYSSEYDVNVAASEPSLQSDGGSLANGDVWVDSDALEDFPKIYKRKSSAWVLVDNTDQVTSDGILFTDMGPSTALVTGSLDSDAPLASTVPNNILAWNKRGSGKNVKQYKINYTTSGVNHGNVWVDHSGNKSDGSPYMGRKAQRKVIVNGLQSSIAANEDIRSEVNFFNLISTPGYPELIDEMITLNTDKKEVAFIVGDSPLRLKSDATSVSAWAKNSNNASENGDDGLISSSPYVSVHYPSGLTTNLDGTNVMVPASHIALRTMAFNDNVAYQWFAPAGYQRGLVQNATSVGYLDSTENEFKPVSLNEGQRDTLYSNKVNPIANFPGRGLVVFGQKTLNPTASALDRINVARLINYIRYQLDISVKPFLFEPNDGITRSGVKRVADSLLSELVTLRGLFDFISVCDTTNNTAARIDRNELYLDIAIQPTKAVEFIYIPIRIQSTLGQTGSS